MVKKYKSKMRTMGILVNIGEETIRVDFKWDLIYTNSAVRGCSFSTDDKKLQKALEAHEYFNRKLEPSFWTDDVDETPAKKEASIKEDAMEKKSRKLIREEK